MRDEESDHIRLYSPVLHRILILLAVIAAVPVVLWSISAFVRTYVAPPRLPTFHAVAAASSKTTPGTGTVADTASLPTSATDTASKSDARSHVADIKNPLAASAAQDSAAAPEGGPYVPVPAGTTAPQSMAATAYASPDDATGTAVLPAPPSNPAPSNVAALDTPTPADATPASIDTAPAAEPLAGPVPLPPHRPRVFAMAQTAIPVPRPRPAESAPAPVQDTNPGPLDWLGKIFRQNDQ
jgi:cytoskeletal protein RodZ